MSKNKTLFVVRALWFIMGALSVIGINATNVWFQSLPTTRVVECWGVTYTAHQARSLVCLPHGGAEATDKWGNKMFYQFSVYAEKTVFDHVYQRVPMPEVFTAGDIVSSDNTYWMMSADGESIEVECSEGVASYPLLTDQDISGWCGPLNSEFGISARISVIAMEVPHK